MSLLNNIRGTNETGIVYFFENKATIKVLRTLDPVTRLSLDIFLRQNSQFAYTPLENGKPITKKFKNETSSGFITKIITIKTTSSPELVHTYNDTKHTFYFQTPTDDSIKKQINELEDLHTPNAWGDRALCIMLRTLQKTELPKYLVNKKMQGEGADEGYTAALHALVYRIYKCPVAIPTIPLSRLLPPIKAKDKLSLPTEIHALFKKNEDTLKHFFNTQSTAHLDPACPETRRVYDYLSSCLHCNQEFLQTERQELLDTLKIARLTEKPYNLITEYHLLPVSRKLILQMVKNGIELLPAIVQHEQEILLAVDRYMSTQIKAASEEWNSLLQQVS
jgi:hypothetical protein